MAEQIRSRRLKGVNIENETLVIYPPIGRQWTAWFPAYHPWLETVISQQRESVRWTDLDSM